MISKIRTPIDQCFQIRTKPGEAVGLGQLAINPIEQLVRSVFYLNKHLNNNQNDFVYLIIKCKIRITFNQNLIWSGGTHTMCLGKVLGLNFNNC